MGMESENLGNSTTPLLIEPGTDIAGFIIESVLESNHVCTVYKAYQTKERRNTALRIINPAFASKAGYVDRFLSAGGAYSSVEHPSAQQCYGAGTAPSGEYYAATEYVEGCDLAATIAGRGYFSAKEGAAVFFRVASALDEVYNKTGLVHGDISMSNIIITPANEVKVINFGRVLSFKRSVSSKPELIAVKPGFAPEILSCLTSELSIKTDMYSFGAVFYNVLTGIAPYAVNGDHDNAYRTACVSSLRRDVPDELSVLISRLISEAPERRPDSWSEILASLAPIAGEEYTPPEECVSCEPVEPVRRAWLYAKVNPVFFFGIILLLGGMLLMTVMLYSRSISSTMESVGKMCKRNPAERNKINEAGKDTSSDSSGISIIESVPEETVKPETAAKPVQDMKEQPLKVISSVPEPVQSEITPAATAPVQVKIKSVEVTPVQPEIKPIVPAPVQVEVKSVEVTPAQPEITPAEAAFTSGLKTFLSVDITGKSTEELLALKSDIEELVGKPENKVFSDKLVTAEIRESILRKITLINENILKKTADENLPQGAPAAVKQAEQSDARVIVKPVEQPDVPPNPDEGIDELNLILSTFPCVPSELVEKLAEWNRKYSTLLPDQAKKATFFRDAALKSIPLRDIVVTNQDMLKKSPLPGSLAPGLVIDSFNSKGLKMTSQGDGVKVGSTIPFSSLKDEDYAALVKSVFIGNKDKFLALIPDHQNAVIASCILSGDADSLRLVLDYRGAQAQDITFASDSLRLLKDSSAEVAAIKAWKSIKSKDIQREGRIVSEMLSAFIESSSKTDFFSRNGSEIKKMRLACPKYDLESLASADVASLKGMVKPGNLSALSEFANVYARYSMARGVSHTTKEALVEMMACMVSSLRLKKSFSMPFYPAWEDTKPGAAWSDDVPARSVGENLDTAPPHSKTDCDRLVYRFIAETDAGMWNGLREYMTIKRGIMLNLVDSCSVSGAYSIGMAADRFLMSSLREPVYARMSSSLFDGKSHQNEAVFAVCMEYNMLIRNYKRCGQLYSKYSMTGESKKLNGAFRLSLLNILRAVSDPATTNNDYSRLTSALSSYYSTYRFGTSAEAMQNDIAACSASGNLMFSDKSVTNAVLDAMRKDFTLRDVTSRIVANAVAKALCSNKIKAADAKSVIDKLSENVSDNNAGAELWETLAILKIASASSYDEMYMETCRLLDDKRICSIQAYPRLQLLKAGLLHAATGGKSEPIFAEYTDTVADYPAASQAELSAQKLFSTRALSLERLENLTNSGFHKETAWLGAAVSLLNRDSSAEILSFVALDSVNFNWPERLMLHKLGQLQKDK